MDTIPQLPPSITAASIREATLPVKIEAARRAIANCTDLPELMRYRDYAQGIAAAVKIMKNIAPEMIANANRMMKESQFKLGELLLLYSGEPIKTPTGKHNAPSPRTVIAKSLGLNKGQLSRATRIAYAPPEIKTRILENPKSLSLDKMALMAPSRRKSNVKFSDALREILGLASLGTHRLTTALRALHDVPLSAFKRLTPEERKSVKSKIVECQELLDAMDQRL